jgi:integrase
MDRMAMLETEAQPQGWRTHWRREGAAQDLAEVDMVADRIHEQTAKFAPVLDATADKPRLPALSEVADDWNRRTAPSKGTLKIRATILRRIREVLGDPALAQVTRQMVRDFIGQIERLPSVTGLPAKLRNASVPALLDWADKHPEHPRVYPITVRNHAMILRSLLSWAVKEDIIPSNPALNIGLAKDERDRERDQHHAAVPWNAMPAFMAKLRATPGTTARALEFTILTAARTEQTLGMQWSELDVPGRLWTVPKGRMKGGLKEHRVFLSQVAVDVLPDQAGAHVFKRSKGDRPLPDNALRKLLETIAPGVTVHGFRSSFRDWVAEATTHDAAAAELALAHTVGTAVELAYRRGDMLAKRAKLMQDWAEFCAGG